MVVEVGNLALGALHLLTRRGRVEARPTATRQFPQGIGQGIPGEENMAPWHEEAVVEVRPERRSEGAEHGHQGPSLAQDAVHLRQRRLRLWEMLEGVRADDDVERAGSNWNHGCVCSHEVNMGAALPCKTRTSSNVLGRKVDPHHLESTLSEGDALPAQPATDIQDSLARER